MALTKADILLIQKTMAETSRKSREVEIQKYVEYLLLIALGFLLRSLI